MIISVHDENDDVWEATEQPEHRYIFEIAMIPKDRSELVYKEYSLMDMPQFYLSLMQ